MLRILNKLKLTGSIENRAQSGRPRKLNEAAKTFIEEQMRANEGKTSCQIQKRLQKCGFTVHASTVRRFPRLDSSKHEILPDDTRSKQGKEAGVRTESYRHWRYIPQRGLQRWMLDFPATVPPHLLLKNRRTSGKETQTKASIESARLGRYQQTLRKNRQKQ